MKLIPTIIKSINRAASCETMLLIIPVMNFGEEELLNEIRGGIKNGCKKIMKTQRLMTIKKISKMLSVAFYVGTGLKKSYKTEKQTGKYQKVRDKGQSPSSYPSEKYQKVRDHCHATDKYRERDRSMCTSYFCHNHSKKITRVFSQ